MADALVIGYGNDLRSDDGAGRVVAARIGGRGLPGVEVRTLPQLTPELATAIAGRDLVVFVDANVDVTEVTVDKIAPASRRTAGASHYGDPASLLAMTAAVGTVPGCAYLVSVPVHSLCLGFELSLETAAFVDHAIELIDGLLTGVITR